ncbi:hypothetical protein B0H14DRAFT_2632995 [Mycena olivaceomarginata]|nr:hypothetical protein B0H14DRAFT_2632995 [Mycena olivaceomarginata]
MRQPSVTRIEPILTGFYEDSTRTPDSWVKGLIPIPANFGKILRFACAKSRQFWPKFARGRCPNPDKISTTGEALCRIPIKSSGYSGLFQDPDKFGENSGGLCQSQQNGPKIRNFNPSKLGSDRNRPLTHTPDRIYRMGNILVTGGNQWQPDDPRMAYVTFRHGMPDDCIAF